MSRKIIRALSDHADATYGFAKLSFQIRLLDFSEAESMTALISKLESSITKYIEILPFFCKKGKTDLGTEGQTFCLVVILGDRFQSYSSAKMTVNHKRPCAAPCHTGGCWSRGTRTGNKRTVEYQCFF